MKKILASLAVLIVSELVATPVIATYVQLNQNKMTNNSDNDTNDYLPYQAQTTWESYIHNNQTFINFIKNTKEISDDYVYQNSNIKLNTIKNVKTGGEVPIGTLLMNGKIQTTVGNPDMASQHIIDNTNGSNPITVNYDSKTVTNTVTISAAFSESFSVSMSAEEKLEIPFDTISVSTSLSFNTSASFSTTTSTEQTVTFDKFSITIKQGDKEEVDYVIMQNKQDFNMVLKAQLDISNCNFVFVNKNNFQDTKIVSWLDLANDDQYNQPFAEQLSNSLSASEIKENVQPFLDIDKINDPTS